MRTPVLLILALIWFSPAGNALQVPICGTPPPPTPPPAPTPQPDPTPPPTPEEPTPSPGGGPIPAPATPGPSAPAPGPRGPAATGPSSAPSAPKSPEIPESGFLGSSRQDSWEAWWLYNRDQFLDTKSAVYKDDPTTGSADFFLGHGSETGELAGAVPTDEQISSLVLPALLKAWNKESSSSVRLSCIAAFSQIGDFATKEQESEIAEILRGTLKSGNKEAVEVSAAALGLVGRRELVPMLCEILADSKRGRKLCGSNSVPERVRSFAAYGLAIAAQRDNCVDIRSFAQGRLIAALETDDGRKPDLGVACVSALGVLGELSKASGDVALRESSTASGYRSARLDVLTEMLGDHKVQRIVRAHVPRAIARQLPDEGGELRERGVKAILDGLNDRAREVRYGCIQALGMLGDCDADKIDDRVRRELFALAKTGDLTDRNFSRIALGEIAGRSGGPGSEAEDARRDIQKLLLRDLGGRKNQLRSWAAVSLGVMAHGLRSEGVTVSPSVTSALRMSFESAKAPEEVGALAIGIGLCRDISAADMLVERFDKVSSDTTKGWIALSLGMIDARHTLPHLQQQLSESLNRPGLMLNSTIALALLGDKGVVEPLVTNMLTSKSSLIAASVAQSLAFVGDRRAIAPLIETLDRKDIPDRTRSYAAIALGIVGDRELVPWTTSISGHLNYMALTESLHSSQVRGFLSMR